MAKLASAPNSPVGSDTKRSTTALNKVGAIFSDSDGNRYRYIKASGAIATNAPVSITGGVSAAVVSADAKGFEGVATAAFADQEYGFICIEGKVLALVPSGVALGDPLTAGNGALSSTLTNAVKHATVMEAPVLLSGTTQVKQVWLH